MLSWSRTSDGETERQSLQLETTDKVHDLLYGNSLGAITYKESLSVYECVGDSNG